MVLPTHIDAVADKGRRDVSGSRQRAHRMAELREQGHLLDEIALIFGVSRERVRQILRAHGGPDAQQVAAARRRRIEQQVHARIDELLGMWRAGQPPASAASALGLQAAACRSAIARDATEVDRAARKASLAKARAMTTIYTDGDIAAAVSAVAAGLGRVPSAKEYGALARERDYPCLATVLNRMGGWTNAVHAAGLTPSSTPTRTPTRTPRWTAEACWSAMRRSVAELGHIPSIAGYDRYAADRIDLPSSATLRNRLGRWSQITTQLAAEREPAHHPHREIAPYTQFEASLDQSWPAASAA
jgi:hypothetical protein